MSERIMFNCTHGKDDPERAILPFMAANIAAAAGQTVSVVCTIEAVWLGTIGGDEGIVKDGLAEFSQLYDDFVANGGEVWLCSACTKPRGITEEQLKPGASIVGAAQVVEEVVAGARSVAFA
jgi:predicted peroxiredoxin